ncbi:MAG: CDP-archaeol synthase [Candidatus Roizmanbacteria bacterium]
MSILKDLLYLLFLFFPAGMANAAPVIAAKIPLLRELNLPLDFGVNVNGKRLFGENKTFRGLFTGIFAAGIGVGLQQYLFLNFAVVRELVVIDYLSISKLFLILALGIGPLIGDAIESTIKRQCNIASGQSWMPFDQIDYILGTIVFTLPLFQLHLSRYLLLFVLGIVAHVLTNLISYLLKLKRVPY